MKKYIIALFLVVSLFMACEKEFLEEKAVKTLTQSFYNTQEGLEALVNGSYQAFRFKSEYDQGMTLFGVANDCEVFCQSWGDELQRCDNGKYLSTGWAADATDGKAITSKVYYLIGSKGAGNTEIVEGMYPSIIKCNVFLENYAELDAAVQDALLDSKGEILFIRSYCYYLLTNVLGEAPLITQSFKSLPEPFYFPKAPIDSIYTMMIKDLTEAIGYLPDQVVSGGEADASNLGRVNKQAAQHFLAKVYLNRAQAANWKNSGEEHLAMLYKGGDAVTDLDSCIKYATLVINKKMGETEYGGLAPSFADLWALADPVTSNTNYPRDLESEIMLSAQYTFDEELNGRYGLSSSTLYGHAYNQDLTKVRAGVTRNNTYYPRPWRAFVPNDWAYDMYTDKANDSRFWGTYMQEYKSNDAEQAEIGIQFDEESAYYFNERLIDKFPGRYGDTGAYAGTSKIEYDLRALVFIENSKDEPLDSLWVVSQPYALCARWMAGSPDGAGYYTYDGTGNITGFRAGADIDPDNPVVTDVSNRKLYYRYTPDPNFERYSCDATDASARFYNSTRKYWDLNRGGGSDVDGPASIDVPIFRLAETYLIRAEAYGRNGEYPSAIADINVVRERAAYHPGETRSDILVTMQPGVLTGRYNVPESEKVAPYTVSTDNSYEELRVNGDEWNDGTDKAKMENYPPTVTNHPTSDPELNRFIHFIYNEKAREFIFEFQITEDLHNAGILYDRIYYRDYYGAPAESTGTDDYPFPEDEGDVARAEGNGAIGTGRGFFQKYHTFKPWPGQFLDLLKDEQGNPLEGEKRTDYQNPGY